MNRVRLITFVWLTLLGVTAFAQTENPQAPRADFKGARLGMTMGEWKQLNGGALAAKHPCKPLEEKYRELGDITCASYKAETVAGAPVISAIYYFKADKLVRVNLSFATEDFLRIATALEERFGKPRATERPIIQNRAGATFENDVRSWRIGTDTVEVRKYAGHVTDGVLLYDSQKAISGAKARTKQQASEGKKDL